MKRIVTGIDAGREKPDFCLLEGEKMLKEFVGENSAGSVKRPLKGILKEFRIEASDLLPCAEYTGRYGYPPACACEELGVAPCLENPAQIKLSSGVHRGKNDRPDARKTAVYAVRFYDGKKLFSLPEKNIATLKQLASERDMYMADKAKHQGQLTDQKRFMNKNDYAGKSCRLKRQIREPELSVAEIEAAIETLITGDETPNRQHELLLSIDGAGERTAVKMTVETNAFRDFDNGRQFCCHAGVAPFRYSSGSSIRSGNHVSHGADKSIKALLHMAAPAVATRAKSGELKEYYDRKVAEGKNKMSVLNAVRAKLVLRMFAVIKNNIFYKQNYAFALA